VALVARKLWLEIHVSSAVNPGTATHNGTESEFNFKRFLAPVTEGLVRNDRDGNGIGRRVEFSRDGDTIGIKGNLTVPVLTGRAATVA